MRLNEKVKNAIKLGTLCSIAYFAVYIARNILGAVTPQMVNGGYTEEYIGSISSLYLTFYAIGQLINGIIGDKIKAKWMISIGLIGAAVTNFVFSIVTATPTVAMIVYGLTGYFLSMIYGPMTKVISENTEPLHATRCTLGLSFASLFGSPAARLLAALMTWQSVFTVSSSALALMAILIFLFFTVFERRKIVKYGQFKRKDKEEGNIRLLFKRDIIKFSLVSILTGVVRTSVVFWLPTYFNKYLGYDPNISAAVFTAATLVISLAAFIAVFIYERLGYNMNRSLLVFFIGAAVFFIITYFVKHPIINIAFIVLSIISANCASSMLWNIYCPSLYDTGMVSSVTGFLGFLSYMAAAAANKLFATAATDIGWGNLILVWAGFMGVGVLISLPYKKIISTFSNGKK